jgi:hypothetical protein
MIPIPHQDREHLLAHEEPAPGTAVSIFMPTHRAGRETLEDPIRLKTLLDRAEARLVEDGCGQGINPRKARERLAAARALVDDEPFWRTQRDGLAIFSANGEQWTYRLPLTLPEVVVVGRRFHIKPLLPFWSDHGSYCILALSQHSVRLFEAPLDGGEDVRELDLPPETPRDMRDLTRFIEEERQLQLHTGAPMTGGRGVSLGSAKRRTGERMIAGRQRAAVFHGHGSGGDRTEDKRRTAEFCQMVSRGVKRRLTALPGASRPLVLVAAEPIASIYREVNDYPRLHESFIRGNPEGDSPQQLAERCRPLMGAAAGERLRHVLDRFAVSKEIGRASTDLKDVLTAAHNGQIDTIFVAQGVQTWGRFDPATRETRRHRQMQPGDDELLDLAAARSLQSGASAYLLEREQMPDRAMIGAVFRYVPVV